MRAAKQAKEQEAAAAAAEDGGSERGDEDFGSHMLKQMQAKRRAMGLEPAEAPGAEGQRGQGAATEQRQQQGGNEPELDYGESEEEEEAAAGGDSGEDEAGEPAAHVMPCLRAWRNCRPVHEGCRGREHACFQLPGMHPPLQPWTNANAPLTHSPPSCAACRSAQAVTPGRAGPRPQVIGSGGGAQQADQGVWVVVVGGCLHPRRCSAHNAAACHVLCCCFAVASCAQLCLLNKPGRAGVHAQ